MSFDSRDEEVLEKMASEPPHPKQEPKEPVPDYQQALSNLSNPELLSALEAVMNSIRNSLGMRETEIAREPSRLWNPHFYATFAQVHNTL
jgi:hypothetical protein